MGPYCRLHVARSAASSQLAPGTPAAETDRLLQSLAITLERENARAVLRRLPEGGEEAFPFAEP